VKTDPGNELENESFEPLLKFTAKELGAKKSLSTFAISPVFFYTFIPPPSPVF